MQNGIRGRVDIERGELAVSGQTRGSSTPFHDRVTGYLIVSKTFPIPRGIRPHPHQVILQWGWFVQCV